MEHSRRGRTDTSAICVSVCVPVAGKGGATDRGGWGREKKKKTPTTCSSLGGSHGSSRVYFRKEQTKTKIRDVTVSSISRYRCYKESQCRRGCTAVSQPSLFKGERKPDTRRRGSP